MRVWRWNLLAEDSDQDNSGTDLALTKEQQRNYSHDSFAEFTLIFRF